MINIQRKVCGGEGSRRLIFFSDLAKSSTTTLTGTPIFLAEVVEITGVPATVRKNYVAASNSLCRRCRGFLTEKDPKVHFSVEK